MDPGHLWRLGVGRIGVVDDQGEAIGPKGARLASLGERSSPSQVWRTGIAPPGSKLGDESAKSMAASSAGGRRQIETPSWRRSPHRASPYSPKSPAGTGNTSARNSR